MNPFQALIRQYEPRDPHVRAVLTLGSMHFAASGRPEYFVSPYTYVHGFLTGLFGADYADSILSKLQ
jgi:hypothetical protein